MYYDGLPSEHISPLVQRIGFPVAPSPAVAATFAQATADATNPSTARDLSDSTHHATFVDDNLLVKILRRIILGVQRSTGSCYLCFGYPSPFYALPASPRISL